VFTTRLKCCQIQPGQEVIACSCCGQLLHTACVEEASTNIWGHHLWFANERMRAFVDEHQLVGLNVALCRECHGELSEQILSNYKALGKFDEGARFLDEFGRAEEVR
jgi:hypothetical protein